MERDPKHFYYIFWFIVGLCVFGAAFTIFLVLYLPVKVAERIADTALIFWLSTAVSGGIGYLIGSSAQQIKKNSNEAIVNTPEGTKTTLTNEPANDETK